MIRPASIHRKTRTNIAPRPLSRSPPVPAVQRRFRRSSIMASAGPSTRRLNPREPTTAVARQNTTSLAQNGQKHLLSATTHLLGALNAMRLTVLAAVAIIVWAAVLNIGANVHPLDQTRLAASAVLALAVAIQRVNGVQKWLSKSKNHRKEQAEVLAQQTLINLCMHHIVSSDLLDLRVHVWEVPLWYRRIFPYSIRQSLKRAAARNAARRIPTWTIRPTFRRVAALGLVKQAPSGIRFRKGNGLIGVCVANNDHSEFITLDISNEPYCHALESATELQWSNYGPEITHNLTLAEARKLSHSYGQVISRVVQDMDSGEAIGCVTISAKEASSSLLHLVTSDVFKTSIATLALGVAHVLA